MTMRGDLEHVLSSGKLGECHPRAEGPAFMKVVEKKISLDKWNDIATADGEPYGEDFRKHEIL